MTDSRRFGGVAAFAVVISVGVHKCLSFQVPHSSYAGRGGVPKFFASSITEEESSTQAATSLNPKAVQLKDDLVALAAATRRGFSASRSDRDKAKEIINDLSKYSPSDEPAAAYYSSRDDTTMDNSSTLAGKWTLIYTDAPDITSLEGGPLSTAKLGKIGQECEPPMIKNVIEWQRPDWAASLPFSGGESSRVLQKVCCEGSATPDNPKTVDLKIAGLELSGMNGSESEEGGDNSGLNAFINGPAALLENNPVKLQGPLTAPFGKFDIMYLDGDMRITKTYQGFFAVNIREEEENEWF